jgi:hypothetical protein
MLEWSDVATVAFRCGMAAVANHHQPGGQTHWQHVRSQCAQRLGALYLHFAVRST